MTATKTTTKRNPTVSLKKNMHADDSSANRQREFAEATGGYFELENYSTQKEIQVTAKFEFAPIMSKKVLKNKWGTMTIIGTAKNGRENGQWFNLIFKSQLGIEASKLSEGALISWLEADLEINDTKTGSFPNWVVKKVKFT